MSNELARNGAGDVVRAGPQDLARQPNDLTSGEKKAYLAVRGAEARVQGAAWVTRVALVHAQLLSAQQAEAMDRAPLGDQAYAAIVARYVAVACDEISRLNGRPPWA